MASTTEPLLYLPEPSLTFGCGQSVEDPRDGLTLFGPLDKGGPYGIRAGVIGTARGIESFVNWARRIQGPLADGGSQIARPPFPGFEAAFHIPWNPDPVLSIAVSEPDLLQAVHVDDRHQRVFRTVTIYADRLVDTLRTEEVTPDLWFVIVPDFVYEFCRPQSSVAKAIQVAAPVKLGARLGRRLRKEPSLFAEENAAAVAYQYDVDFRNQLKARLLPSLLLTQIVRESTIAPIDLTAGRERQKRDVAAFQAAIAWNISTASFYKAGGRPWKMHGIRDGVCYVGLVFKKDETQPDPRHACCAAQMFLDSGDGVVFRGAVGPWYAPKTGEFHLTGAAATALIKVAVDSYATNNDGRPPRELFIHGKVAFTDEEWEGFAKAVDSGSTNLVGIKIRDDGSFRLFRSGAHPVLRGLAYPLHRRAAYLWTKGYSPRLQTYAGREVPRPLRVDVLRGEADLTTVLADIQALTKLNYNTCLLADGLPVTLRFADAVGEILTAGPMGPDNPLPFKHYI